MFNNLKSFYYFIFILTVIFEVGRFSSSGNNIWYSVTRIRKRLPSSEVNLPSYILLPFDITLLDREMVIKENEIFLDSM